MNASAITASKLFRTSTRKSLILGKMSSISNSGALNIQTPDQVHTNVAEESEESNKLKANIHKEAEHREEDDAQVSDKKQTNDDNETSARVTPKPSPSAVPSTDGQEAEPVSNEPTEVSEQKYETDTGSDAVEESTSVNASSSTSLPRTDVTDHMHLEVQDIKGILNSREDTDGVSRVSTKDDKEVWIYYNDNVNLNDVMVQVIEELNRPGYTYLEFNRLARSDNAVVFVIIKNDTERVKKPESFSDGKE